jgi:hypothetical protein
MKVGEVGYVPKGQLMLNPVGVEKVTELVLARAITARL